ncbi:MAG: glycerate kinase, partial [Opitutales bacterium]|nr:glycerate kinase [Opitutales bacterium]
MSKTLKFLVAPDKFRGSLSASQAAHAIKMGILSEAKKKSSLPIITKTSKFDAESKLFEKDILSTDIFSLCASKP